MARRSPSDEAERARRASNPTMSGDIDGDFDPAFARVRDAFAGNFAAHGELGAALCVVVAGRRVVNLWGGHADAARTRPWRSDTVVNIFSSIKGVTAACAHFLVEKGELDLDAPVSRLWPELGGGKQAITVRQLLSHRAGLAALHQDPPRGAALSWEAMTRALADETPWWPPGEAHGYHAVTFGWLVGEVVRRAARRPLRAVLGEMLGPLGADIDIGWHGDVARVAEIVPVRMALDAADPFVGALCDRSTLSFHALLLPTELATPGLVNSDAWRDAELPASNGHASANGLASFYAALIAGANYAGHRPLGRETVAQATAPHAEGPDRVLIHPSRFALGFMLPSPLRPFSRNPRAFGHSGAGGSFGFADPDRELAVGYVVNQPIASSLGGDPRWASLIDALYS
jgi:CubicO group peptidase (beta-lactamase class C family)